MFIKFLEKCIENILMFIVMPVLTIIDSPIDYILMLLIVTFVAIKFAPKKTDIRSIFLFCILCVVNVFILSSICFFVFGLGSIIIDIGLVEEYYIINLLIICASYICMYFLPMKKIFEKDAERVNSLNKIKKREKYKHYREINMETMTPLKAWILTNDKIKQISSKDFENILTSTIMYLNLNNYLEIEKKSEKTMIKLNMQKNFNELSGFEAETLSFLMNIIENTDEFEIEVSEIQKYIKKNKSEIVKLYRYLEDFLNSIISSDEIFNKDFEYMHNYSKAHSLYSKFGMFGIWKIYLYIWPLPFVLLMLSLSDFAGILGIISTIIIQRKYLKFNEIEKVELLSEIGIEESEKYYGLKRYLRDFSLIHDRELIEVELWEEYLMYATVFGMAKKVIKQIKLDYPDYESIVSLRLSKL